MKNVTLKLIPGMLLFFALTTGCKPKTTDTNNPAKESTKEESEFSDADYENGFVGSFDMEMNANEKTTKTSMYSDGKQTAMIMTAIGGQEGETRIIFDPANKSMTSLMTDTKTGKKMGIKMKMPDIKVNPDDKTVADVKIDKTNETKVIDGYKCRKYIMETSKGVTEMWITRAIKGGLSNMFNMSNNDKNSAWTKHLNDVKGFLIEMNTTDKVTQKIVTMHISNIKTGDPDPAIFSTDGYTLQDMSEMSNMMEQLKKSKAH